MKITICGSMIFYDEMLAAKKELEIAGHQVKLPPFEVKDENGNMIPVKEFYSKRKSETDDASWVWDRKSEAMKLHFQNKKIFLLNNIPNMSCREEILGMKPIIINRDLEKIK